MNAIDEAARATRIGQELIQASTDVIARRLEIAAAALRDPVKADLAEFGRMGPEKVEALTASAGVGLSGAMAMAATGAAVAARETAAARGALEAVMTAPDPASAALAHGRWATAALGRAVTDGWSLGATMLKLQADALLPIHSTALANAKRLGGRDA